MEWHERDHEWYRTTDSAGVIVFREASAGLTVLLITMKGRRQSFPKGHIEDGETEEAAALREVREETGIQARLIPGFREETPSVRAGDQRRIIFFLGVYESGTLCAQETEVRRAFWCPVSGASAEISFDSDREIWRKALECYQALQKSEKPE